MPAPSRQSPQTVELLRLAIDGATATLNDVPRLLKQVIRERIWRDRVVEQTGKAIRFADFYEFVQTAPPEGMGTDIKRIQRLCADDVEALDMIDRLLQRKRGGDRSSNVCSHDIVKVDPCGGGNSREYALRRLRNHRPDLHAEVIAKHLSPHKAMQIAGFRHRTFTVPFDPDEAARAIVKRFNDRQLSQILCVIREALQLDGEELVPGQSTFSLQSEAMTIGNRLGDTVEPLIDRKHD